MAATFGRYEVQRVLEKGGMAHDTAVFGQDSCVPNPVVRKPSWSTKSKILIHPFERGEYV